MLDNFVDVFSCNSKDPFWKSMFLLVTVLMPCSCTHRDPGATGGVVMSWSASPHRVPPAISMMSFGARSIRSAERVRPKVIKLIPSERHRSLVRVGLLVYDVVVMGANVKSACVRVCCVGQRVDRGYRGFM